MTIVPLDLPMRESSKKFPVPTTGNLLTLRPAMEISPPTMAFDAVTILVVEFVNDIIFEVVFPAAEICSSVWSWVRRFVGKIFLRSLLLSLTYT